MALIPRTIRFVATHNANLAGLAVATAVSVTPAVCSYCWWVDPEQNTNASQVYLDLLLHLLVGFVVGKQAATGSDFLGSLADHCRTLGSYRQLSRPWPHGTHQRLMLASLKAGGRLGMLAGLSVHTLAYFAWALITGMGGWGRYENWQLELGGVKLGLLSTVLVGGAMGSLGLATLIGAGSCRLLW